MEHAVQPLIFYPSDRREDARFADGAVLCLRIAREWFARELNGKTFRLEEPVVYRSRFTERELHDRHRRDGDRDHTELWVGAMREAIHSSAITGGPDRVYYFVLVGDGDDQGWSWQRDYFGCAAYIGGEAAEVMAGLEPARRSRLRGRSAAAGLMAHELAHCFGYSGLSQLPNLDGSWQNLMGPGYLSFPACVLSDDQRESLSASPFLTDSHTLLTTWR